MISACGGRRFENVIAAREGRVLEHLGLEIAGIGDLDVDDGSRVIPAGFEPRHHEAGVGRQLQPIDAHHDLVAERRIEVHAVGLEQIVALRRRRPRP